MNKHKLLIWLILFHSSAIFADSIAHFMGIAQNIPRMEMKADSSSQAWARSARNILLLTGESIWESLKIANQNSAQLGNPLFCVPAEQNMTAEKMYDLIQGSYQKLNLSVEDQNQMTVAQVALRGLEDLYPCQARTSRSPQITVHQKGEGVAQKMLHVSGL
ncbi:MAG TPA: phosphatase [Legionellales bacterium]|nr:phosphatase [Legionellales bacterium]